MKRQLQLISNSSLLLTASTKINCHVVKLCTFTNVYKLSSCCVSCIFGPLTLEKGMYYKSTTKSISFLSETSTCATADHFRSFNPVCLPNCQYRHGCMCLIFSFSFLFFSPSLFRVPVKWPPLDFAITTKRPTALTEPV